MQRYSFLKWVFGFVLILLLLYTGLWFYSAKKVRDMIVSLGENSSFKVGFESLVTSSSLFDFGVLIKKPTFSNLIGGGGLISSNVSMDDFIIRYNPFTAKLHMFSDKDFFVDVRQDAIGTAVHSMHKVTSCKSTGNGVYGLSLNFGDLSSFFLKPSIFDDVNSYLRYGSFKVSYSDHGFNCSISDSGSESSAVNANIMPTNFKIKFKFSYDDSVDSKSSSKSKGDPFSDISSIAVKINLDSGGSEYKLNSVNVKNPSINAKIDFGYENKHAFSIMDLDVNKLDIIGDNYAVLISGDVKKFNTLTREFSGVMKFDIKNHKNMIDFLISKYIVAKSDIAPDDYNKVVSTIAGYLTALSEPSPLCKDKTNCDGILFLISRNETGVIMMGKEPISDFFDKVFGQMKSVNAILDSRKTGESSSSGKGKAAPLAGSSSSDKSASKDASKDPASSQPQGIKPPLAVESVPSSSGGDSVPATGDKPKPDSESIVTKDVEKK